MHGGPYLQIGNNFSARLILLLSLRGTEGKPQPELAFDSRYRRWVDNAHSLGVPMWFGVEGLEDKRFLNTSRKWSLLFGNQPRLVPRIP